MNRLRKGTTVLLAFIIPVLFVACSSNAPQDTVIPNTSTAVASPSPVPTATGVLDATVSPTSTASPVSTSTPRLTSPTPTAFAIEDLSLPNCDTGARNASGQLGTAPAPTPTPFPDDGSRDPELVAREIGEYLSFSTPIVEHLAAWNELFNSAWETGLEPVKQAESLQLLGTRLIQACDSLILISQTPPEVAGFDALLREAVRVRHAWTAIAIEDLTCCGTSYSTETDTGNDETTLLLSDLASESRSLVQEQKAPLPQSRTFTDEVIGVEVFVEAGWLVAASGLNPVFYGPVELNREGLSGLGPDRWQNGTAARIRRLRNPEPIDAATASERFVSLITQQGEVALVEQVSVSNIDSLRHVLEPEAEAWNATVTVFVAGDFTYFIETGCPIDVAGACESVDSLVASLALTR